MRQVKATFNEIEYIWNDKSDQKYEDFKSSIEKLKSEIEKELEKEIDLILTEEDIKEPVTIEQLQEIKNQKIKEINSIIENAKDIEEIKTALTETLKLI